MLGITFEFSNSNHILSKVKKFMPIPKVIHFVWVGQVIPDERLNNILQWANLNKEFQINLWMDNEGAKINSIFGSQFMGAVKDTETVLSATLNLLNNIIVKDIGELKDIENTFYWDCIRYEIDKLRPNYGAASDLLRLIILERFGGAYYDSDVNPIELDNLGIWNNEVSSLYMYQRNCNDIIICDPNNLVLIALRKKVSLNQQSSEKSVIQLMYDTYLADNPFYIISHTLKKTGPDTIMLLTEEERGKIIEKVNLRKTQQIESDKSWCNRGIKKLADSIHLEPLYAHWLKIIIFEIKYLGILRLEDHINSLFDSIDCTDNEKPTLIIEFIDKIKPLLINNVQYVQLTFEYNEILDFYTQNSLMDKTCLLPWDLRFFIDNGQQDKKSDALFKKGVFVLSNLTNIVIQNSNNLHQFIDSLKMCIADAEKLHGKKYDRLERLKNPLQQGMVENIWLNDISNYLYFAVEYIKQVDNNKIIKNMLTNLKKVVQARLNFIRNYQDQTKENLKMKFLSEKLNMVAELDNFVIQDIGCLLSISNGTLANFQSKFEKHDAVTSIWEYSSSDEDEGSKFHQIKFFFEEFKEQQELTTFSKNKPTLSL